MYFRSRLPDKRIIQRQSDEALSVYSKELHRWVAAGASQHITVDKKGTPHKNRLRSQSKATPTNTSASAAPPALLLTFLSVEMHDSDLSFGLFWLELD